MSVNELFQQAQGLDEEERQVLVSLLLATLVRDDGEAVTPPKTGAEIVALLKTMAPIDFVDEGLEDPVMWVKAQRAKRMQRRLTSHDNDSDI